MREYFVDLHVHIGRANDGSPVKITAARDLTMANVLEECMTRKGMDVVGIVDAMSPKVLADIEELVRSGHLCEVAGGGLRYKGAVTLIPGGEVETTEKVADEYGQRTAGSAHCLCYFANLADIKAFTREMSRPGRIKNPNLSSQKCRMTMQELCELTASMGGIVIPAHAFTPHKGVYGCCVGSLREILSAEAWMSVPAVELGLSADTNLADMIGELAEKTFVSNSDAHSLPKIGREYNVVRLERPTFAELVMALRRQDGRGVAGNYGLDPKLGKYHRTYCEVCGYTAHDEPPVQACAICGHMADGRKVVMGVLDRIYRIGGNRLPSSPEHRPPYIHQIPLENLPGIGAKTLDRLLDGRTEMEVLHRLSNEELQALVGGRTAEMIMLAREGRLEVRPGGGGHYGRVTGVRPERGSNQARSEEMM